MNATGLYEAGRLGAAIEAQTEEVEGSPGDPSKRLFLVELLLFAGDLEQARCHAEAITYQDPALDAAVAVYRKLVEAEQARRGFLTGGLTPGFLGEPAGHLRLRLDAANRIREGRPEEAAEALERANEAVPPVQGRLNGQPFQSLRDTDDVFSGVLEVMAHGRYFWVGLEQVRLLKMNPPRFPRDLIFVPAYLELEEEQGEIFLPALYPGSHEHPDDQVKLGRLTEWKELDSGLTLGAGQHTFLRDDVEIGLLEVREWRLDV